MNQPNVIIIMSDQMKATASHLYGSAFCQTPSLERMANEGVLFKHAVTPHPLCVPCRISFWTSQFPHSHGGRRNQTLMPGDAMHAFKLWKAAGYRCGLIGKNHCFEEESDFDLFDVWCEIGHGGLPRDAATKGMDWFRSRESINAAHAVRKNMPETSPQFSYAVSDFPLKDYSTGLVAGQTVRFLEQFGNDPFALWVSIPDPHTPYECPERYAIAPDDVVMPPWRADEYSDVTAPERNRVLHAMIGVEEDSIEDVKGCVGVYHGMVRFLDDGVGQILDALDRLNLRENTIVVFCADHGDFSGEHAQIAKGGAFYDCLTRVPLIVSWPGRVPQGVVDESCVNLIDIVPTVLQLQGFDVPRSMHGEGLPTVTDAAPRDAAFSEYGAGGPAFTMADLEQLEKPWGRRAIGQSLQWREAEGRRKMVRTAEWKYVHDPMGDRDELYDLVNDPWELYNVMDNADHRDIIVDLQLKLADWSIRTEDARPVPMPARGI
ncbi:MAG: sulfatase-like hydrolase/transferase [Candidatus Latescibacteria bacterium]|nr:sulfatase-like hydrolase/transferase [Candidatus Latescibacterota bacterium]